MTPAEESLTKLKTAFIERLGRRADKQDEVYLKTRSGKIWTYRQMAEEIQRDTEDGLEHLLMMMDLAARLISEDKSNF